MHVPGTGLLETRYEGHDTGSRPGFLLSNISPCHSEFIFFQEIVLLFIYFSGDFAISLLKGHKYLQSILMSDYLTLFLSRNDGRPKSNYSFIVSTDKITIQ
jgi:hypothetical protein